MGIFSRKKEEPETTTDDLKDIMEANFGVGGVTPDNQNNDLKELQIANLALATMMDPANLNSTSNLSEDEIDDISDAYYLNSIFQDELIDIKVKTFIELKRSQTNDPKNMLQIISDIVGKAIPRQENTGLQRILGNRFR